MATLGIATNMVLVTFMPELIMISLSKVNKVNDSLLNDKIAGIFNAFFSIGFFLAPLLSGVFVDL
jgi:hypothetical protein